jgi:NAD(P)-dependent dehydrogenase (short-subunit alcohol dehydrogenase family)
MDLALKGKVALVTGAGSQIGFGHAIALALAADGCDVAANDLDAAGAEKTAAAVRALGSRGLAVQADITSSQEVGRMVQTVLDKMGRIDILINNAGGPGAASGPFVNTQEEDWGPTIDLILKGPMLCCKAVLPHMIARKYGKIINISSGLGRSGGPFATVYSSCKAGVIGFTKSLAAEVAPLGINVNSVSPGLSTTNFLRDKEGKIRSPESLERVRATIPLGRLTEPRDVAPLVAFLVSDLAGDIVGQTFGIEGGRYMV